MPVRRHKPKNANTIWPDINSVWFSLWSVCASIYFKKGRGLGVARFAYAELDATTFIKSEGREFPPLQEILSLSLEGN